MSALRFILFFCFSTQLFFSQSAFTIQKAAKPKRAKLSIGAGINRSELFLEQNIKEDERMMGVSTQLVYDAHKVVRFSAEFTHYFPNDLAPKWYNLKYDGVEINCQFKARFENVNAVFYPIVGFSYHSFSGYFTGKNDSKGVSAVYPPNSFQKINWLGFNFGTGYEYKYKRLGFFAEFKLRFGIEHKNFRNTGIKDVSTGTGIKYYFGIPTIRTLFRGGTRNRYFLKTTEAD